MEAQHKQADVLHEQSDEAEQDSSADGDQGVGPHWQDVFLEANQVNDQGAEDEAREEHGGLEASVAEECAEHSEEQVKHTDCGGDDIVRLVTETKNRSLLADQI